MSENQYWHDHVRPKLSPFGKLVRIENSASLGTPDVAYCLRTGPGVPASSGWIELKHLDGLPARRSTPVRIEKLTLEQVRFLEGWAAVGGRAWLLLRAGDRHILMTPYHARQVYEGRYRAPDVVEAASAFAIGKFPAGRMLLCLTAT